MINLYSKPSLISFSLTFPLPLPSLRLLPKALAVSCPIVNLVNRLLWTGLFAYHVPEMPSAMDHSSLGQLMMDLQELDTLSLSIANVGENLPMTFEYIPRMDILYPVERLNKIFYYLFG